jgi:hypothetical protein
VVSILYWSFILFIILATAVGSPKDSTTTLNLPSIPLHVDLMVHVFPAVFVIADFYLLEEKYDQKDTTFYAPLMSFTFAAWYSSLVEYLASFNRRCTCARARIVILTRNFPLILPYDFFSVPYAFLEGPFRYRVIIYVVVAVLSCASFKQLNSWHPGKPIFGTGLRLN